jgi:hypothetical protein
MNPNTPKAPVWTTTAFDVAPDPSPHELAVLEDHLNLCRAVRGRMFLMLCGIEATRAWMVPRVVTTLAVVAAVLIVVNLLIF